jgi:hypothetical protein
MLSHFSELSHFSCYTAQSFFIEVQCSAIFTTTMLTHLQMATVNTFIFAIVLNYFMVLSTILEILSIILLQCSIIL